MGNFIDRIIGWVSPQHGIARHFARERLARAYEAASPRDPWRPRRAGASANTDHQADARRLREKARALVQNVPYIEAGLSGLVADTLGTGIVPRATGKHADILNALFEEWAPVCDADGRFDYYGLMDAAYRAAEVDGESMIRFRWRRPTDGLPVPLQLQLLEIDWLDDTRNGIIDGNRVVNGIEYNAIGAITYYWLWPEHPGEQVVVRTKMQSVRIPASSILHIFSPKRPGQNRGITRLAPIITRVRDLQLYEDAELNRKNLEARLSVLASGDVSGMGQSGPPVDAEEAKTSGELGELSSGSIIAMPPGTNLTVVKPESPPGYVEYVKQQMHIIATGFGVPYETMTGDMSEVNFSSARFRQMSYRRSITRTQWLMIIPKMQRPIHHAFVKAAELAGKIKSIDYKVDFSPPKFDYVNPEQDVKADIAEISAGLATPSEKLRQRGYDPKVVRAEWQADFEELKSSGMLDIMLALQKGIAPAEAAKPAAQK